MVEYWGGFGGVSAAGVGAKVVVASIGGRLSWGLEEVLEFLVLH
jgi:hypothetical protein